MLTRTRPSVNPFPNPLADFDDPRLYPLLRTSRLAGGEAYRRRGRALPWRGRGIGLPQCWSAPEARSTSVLVVVFQPYR